MSISNATIWIGFRISQVQLVIRLRIYYIRYGMIKWHRLQYPGNPFDHQPFPRFVPILWKDFTDFQRYRSLPRGARFVAPSGLWKEQTRSADNKLSPLLLTYVYSENVMRESWVVVSWKRKIHLEMHRCEFTNVHLSCLYFICRDTHRNIFVALTNLCPLCYNIKPR